MIIYRLLSGAEAPITCQMFRTSAPLSVRNVSSVSHSGFAIPNRIAMDFQSIFIDKKLYVKAD
jgi:hypothetical protein